MSEQLILRVGLRDGATFDSFFPGPNAQALHAVQGSEPFVYLWGEAGSGKSHLLQAACQAATERGEPAAYLPLDELVPQGMDPGVLEGLEQTALIALDGLPAVAGEGPWETALFHLYNRVRDAGCRLLAAADGPATALGITLPDLVSRLSWGPVYRIQPLSDTEKAGALQLRARLRGMNMDDEVATYLLRHGPRGTHALFELLDRLDEASLQAQRRLTIPFVRQFL